MNDSPPTLDDLPRTSRRPQFGLAALFWLLFALGMYLAYLRQFSPSVALFGCLVIVLGLVTGALVGLVSRQFVDTTYWATLCAAFAMVSVAATPGLSVAFRLSWCAVGMACGAACAATVGRGLILRVVLGAAVAGIVMGVSALLVRNRVADGIFDALTAPIIGALIGILISIIRFLERDRRLPRYLIATWLLCAVLVGNFLTMVWVYDR